MTNNKRPKDDLLWTISGKTGENLATAYLKWLIDQNNALSGRLIRKLLGQAAGSKIRTFHYIESWLELATAHSDVSSDEIDRGRLDLLIRADEFIIGVESKFYAGFQPNQPGKYLTTVRKKAQSVQGSPFFILLCPKFRLKEAEETALVVASDGIPVRALPWESLLDPSAEDSQESALALSFLHQFYDRCCNPFIQLQTQELTDPGCRTNAYIGDPNAQGLFLRALLPLISDIEDISYSSKPEISAENYYFYTIMRSTHSITDPADEVVGGIGFVNAKYYGLRTDSNPEFQYQRVLVICIDERAHPPSTLDIDGLKSIELPLASEYVTGIIRHKDRDAKVWAVPEVEWRNFSHSPEANRRYVVNVARTIEASVRIQTVEINQRSGQ